MKKLLSCLLLLTTLAVHAQVYNNEWIDHSKTYYKFKVGKTGVYRIPQATLAAAGLASASAEHFQLWRNGVEVPIYTSVAAGPFSASDFIEFWGVMNDGKPDRALYRDPNFQLNNKWSLQTDTASYFLTVNSTGANKRLVNTTNNVAGNTLPAEPYFMHTVGNYFRDRMNGGYAINVGQNLFSSSYDKGEGWTSHDITTGNHNEARFDNLFVAPGGPDAKFKISVSGNALYPRYARVRVNGDSVLRFPFDFFNLATDSTTFPSSKIASNSATIQVANICNLDSCVTNDRMVIHQYELTYPRQFNFGNATSFEFSLPASAAGNYLEIRNFNYGAAAPILLDFTNGRRYTGDIATAGIIKFVLEPSSTPRQFVMIGPAAGNNVVDHLQPRRFTNYADANNQADYLIVSNQRLFAGAGGANPVEEYRAYRSSNSGGAFNAKVFDVEELTDQFGFGIKKHPVAVRNFLLYARRQFTEKPKHVFIIGKGVNYQAYRGNESNPNIEALNLVPTFGVPASDALLTADPGSSIPQISYGRLSVINGAEVATYLKKVKETELAQATLSPNRQDRAWMKNVLHLNGISEPDLKEDINGYYSKYTGIIADTLFGAKVTTFSKSSTDAVQQISGTALQSLFREGLSLISYFGHSSATTLEFNLESPESYQNQGKYPLFIALGCYVGDFFTFNPKRLVEKETIPEKYVLAPDRGTIGFIASTHYGIVHYLDIWNTQLYKAMARTHYGKSIGELLVVTSKSVFDITSQEDFYARSNVEQTELNGDPAVKVNPHAKPDYLVEESFIRVSPEFISVAENSVKVDVRLLNIGRAISDSIVVEVKRQYPDLTSEVVYRKTIKGVRYSDSLSFYIPIEALRDKGINKLTVTVDADNAVDEFYESNNSVTKEFIVYEDEIRPVYPYDFAIINKQNIKLVASTANAFSSLKEYRMEIDTTALFNSPLKRSKSISSVGGALEFEPGFTFKENTVYYWRVAQATNSGTMNWKSASFIYLPNQEVGFNQSHLFQHLMSHGEHLEIDSTSERWKYQMTDNNIFVRHGSWVTSIAEDGGLSIAVNSDAYIRNTCAFSSLVFNVFDPTTLKPMRNLTNNGQGLYESWANNCSGGRDFNFEYRYTDTSSRRKMMNFMNDVIPDGAYVVVRSFTLDPSTFPSFPRATPSDWLSDTTLYGSGKSLYHYLKNAGLTSIDSMNKLRQFVLVYKKGDPTFEPRWALTQGTSDNITLSVDVQVPVNSGALLSPRFGPAKSWKQLHWEGYKIENGDGDNPLLNVIGIRSNGLVDTLFREVKPEQELVDISSVDASQYPFLQLQLKNADLTFHTPYQLKSWRLTYVPVPEGALAPNINFSVKDTVEVGEPLEFKIAFKNVSEVVFDSLLVKLNIIDKNNVTHTLQNLKYKPLVASDTITIIQSIDSKKFVGENALFLEVNPNKDQPEQYHFNNFAYKSIYVVQDTLNPLLDVTFDNVHILNNDIISPKPNILIKLKDDAKWNILNDTSLVEVKVRYPDGKTKPFYFNSSDTLQFSGPQSGSDNSALIHFKPYFDQDGTYELIVSGKDKSENMAGVLEYRVTFDVYNKAMISNLLNYPNPFTTSTAFVFTLTGSEIPQEFKIQILTVTGKIVREITKQELGSLKIGKNITEYKWDGTDQFGQRLANGVYLYRVVTGLDGKRLDKFNSKNEIENTDKYFNKGYGKMYLMR